MSEKPPDPRAGGDDDGERVEDDKGTVDRRVKDRILDARERVDEAEFALFIGQNHLSETERLAQWTTVVRQYIRAVDPLLSDDGVEGAKRFREEVTVGEFEITPPNGKEPWGQIAMSDADGAELARRFDLHPGTDPPEPKTVRYDGLRSLLEWPQIRVRWEADAEPWNPRSGRETLTVERPLPKRGLERAVSLTDRFLQDAGVGLEIGSGRTRNTY